jgi:Pyridoxamine 5'-phosphate oxidase
MATWIEFRDEAPALAAQAEELLGSVGLMFIATLRADGSPRISPMEPVLDGEKLVLHGDRLWLGMMPGATKARDLQRDGRFTLHNATVDKMLTRGDVKLWGVATEVTDHDTLARFAEDIFRSTGYRFEVGKFDAFDVDLLGASAVAVSGDTMTVRTWKPGRGVAVTEKH